MPAIVAVPSEPGEPTIVEPKCATIGQNNTTTNAIVAETISPVSGSAARIRAVDPRECRNPARIAGTLEPAKSSCAAIIAAPTITFVHTNWCSVDGTVERAMTCAITPAPTIHA